MFPVRLAARVSLGHRGMLWWVSCRRVTSAMGRMSDCYGTTPQGECCYSVMDKTGRCVLHPAHCGACMEEKEGLCITV